MTNFGNLPFEKLHAYQESRKLLDAVREAAISEGRLRDQALRAATSVCLNISEGAGRACLSYIARGGSFDDGLFPQNFGSLYVLVGERLLTGHTRLIVVPLAIFI